MQGEQEAADAALKKPAGHDAQLEDPDDKANVPGKQNEHKELPIDTVY